MEKNMQINFEFLKERVVDSLDNTDLEYDVIIKEVNNKDMLKNLIKDYWFLKEDILDDDIYYSLDLVESLYKVYEKKLNYVCAKRVHEMTFGTNGKINEYCKENWKWDVENFSEKESDYIVPTGVCGVLYPPNFLAGYENIIDMIKKYISVDDIVLSYIRIKKGMKCIKVHQNKKVKDMIINGSDFCSLWCNKNSIKNNSGLTNNDICIKDLLNPLFDVRK